VIVGRVWQSCIIEQIAGGEVDLMALIGGVGERAAIQLEMIRSPKERGEEKSSLRWQLQFLSKGWLIFNIRRISHQKAEVVH
jgi:hypothetical protein